MDRSALQTEIGISFFFVFVCKYILSELHNEREKKVMQIVRRVHAQNVAVWRNDD